MNIDFDPSKIPESLADLNWKVPSEDAVYEDGDEYLVAVGVCDRTDYATTWHYEFAVVTIKCDENYFRLECDDETWCWELEDIDAMVRIR